jgi:HlyD family secretion protein
MRRIFLTGGVLGAATLIALLVSQEPASNAQEVQTATVERTSLNTTIETSGTIAPEQTIYLSFGTSGQVEAVNVSIGDEVEAGQTLATLNTDDLEYQVALQEQSLAVQQSNYNELTSEPTEQEITQAQANLVSAEAQLASAQNSLSEAPNSRTVNCSSVNSALRQLEDAQEDYQLYINEGYEWDATFVADPASEAGTQLDEAQNNYDVAVAQCENTTPLSVYEIQVSSAQASVNQAQAALDSLLNGPTVEEIASAEAQLQQSQLQLDNARASLEDAMLNAPFAGVIADVDIVPGQLVNTSTTVITLVDVSRLHVDVSVDELDIPEVSIGQSVNVTPEALNGEAIEGMVVRISPTAQETDGVVTYAVRVDLNETEGLRVGMTTDVEIVVSTEEDVLVVPTDAIQRAGATEFVQVQNDDGTTTNVSVTTGVTVNDQTVVEGDLEEGDTVIVPERENSGGSGFGGPFGG